MTREHKSVLDLQRETQAAEALRAALLALPDMDEATVRDMIEGETSLHDKIATVVSLLTETEVMFVGIAAKRDEFAARAHRYTERKNMLRSMIEQAMFIGEIKKLEFPEATLSLAHRVGGVVVTDETKIPKEFWRVPDPEVDKAKVSTALKDGLEVPGATLGNGTVSLTVRRS